MPVKYRTVILSAIFDGNFSQLDLPISNLR